MALSPMLKQYFDVKAKHPDCLLFFRLGDFYEMFFDDAKLVARELDLVLTGKDCGLEERAPMCGIPYHAVEGYLSKLIAKGYRVAICEQVEDPKTAKGLVKRDVIRIVSPGTVIEGSCLSEDRNNYICSLCYEADGCGIVFADISTGELYATEISGTAEDKLFAEMAAYVPSEVIYNKALPDSVKSAMADRFGCLMTPADESVFTDTATSSEEILRQFPDGGINPSSKPALAAAALLRFLAMTQKIDLSYIKNISYYTSEKFLSIDASTRRSLELCECMRTKEKRASLLWVLDKTKTSPGARLLRQWIEKPLAEVGAIRKRQEAVGELFGATVERGELMEKLKGVVDMERLLTRLVYGTANARDLLAIGGTAAGLPDIKRIVSGFDSPLLRELDEELDALEDIASAIENTIDPEPPVSVREGGMIKKGASAAVDELRLMMNDGMQFMAHIEQTEKERTGIRTLKVGYNKVFGYYIEVSRSFLDSVPDNYIRRQTLTTGERYVTEELKEMESRIIGAKDKDAALEYELFSGLREKVLEQKDRIRRTSAALAAVDCLCSLAEAASAYNYVCPEVDGSDTLMIRDGRHPVVERFVNNSYFVPNDCDMNCGADRIMLITGPNMAGKSTYMRQVALIVLMAQIGSFVPASEAHIGVCDRIFTRVGASDDLSSGDSTFMLEMKEVSYILANATSRSLIIYDEIGRGTSTFDGMSIARAVLEYTSKKICARTLFATHYHELTALESVDSGIRNFNIAAKKRGGDIIFLRKIVRGGTDDSYGIEVAQLAGLPKEVLTRARAILKELEAGRSSVTVKETEDAHEDNITLDDLAADRVSDRIKALDVNTLTPIEAIGILYELKKSLE